MSDESTEKAEAITSFNKIVTNRDELLDNLVKQAIEDDRAYYQEHGKHIDLNVLYYHAHGYSSEIYTMFERGIVTHEEAIKFLKNDEYFKSDEYLNNIAPDSWSIIHESEDDQKNDSVNVSKQEYDID